MCSGWELSFGSVSVAQSLLACQWESRLWSQFGLLSVHKEWTQVLLQHRDYFSRLIPVCMVMTFIQSMELYPLILVLVTVTQFRSHCHCSRVEKKVYYQYVVKSCLIQFNLCVVAGTVVISFFQIWLKYLGWIVLNWHPAYTHEEDLFTWLSIYIFQTGVSQASDPLAVGEGQWQNVRKFILLVEFVND